MSSRPLKNHLLANRKRLGLSQDEVAFLLGVQSGEKVCRYERFARCPPLETALALEAIFHKPVKELFPGLYRQVENEIVMRAKTLVVKAEREKPHQRSARKVQVLKRIALQNQTPTLS
jgi:transcriptional regulator with XRE-family HTH domain